MTKHWVPGQGTLVRLTYASEAALEALDPAGQGGDALAGALRDVVEAARTRNARDGVTGVLLHDGASFGQVLEGPDEVVEATFRRIRHDPRHHHVTAIGIENIAERGFPDWPMGLISRPAPVVPRGFGRWGLALTLAAAGGEAMEDMLRRLGRDGFVVAPG